MSQTFAFVRLASCSWRVMLACGVLVSSLLSSKSVAELFVDIPNIEGGYNTRDNFENQHRADFFSFSVLQPSLGGGSATAYSFFLGLQPHVSFPRIIQNVASGIAMEDLTITTTLEINGEQRSQNIYEFRESVFQSFDTFTTSGGENSGAYLTLVPLDDFQVTYHDLDLSTGLSLETITESIVVDPQAQLSLLTTVPEPSTCVLVILSLLSLSQRGQRR